MRARRTVAALAATGSILATLWALRAFNRLPPRELDEDAFPPRHDSVSPLRTAAEDAAKGHDGHSGIHLLADANDAFAARILLARQAKRHLDLQYYIWHGDRTGTLLLEEVHSAAERGVQVRLLLDDNGISGLDTILSALDRHPNIEVRLFNPFRIRFPKAAGFALDFGRLNRRMHNKSFIVDDAATIVGGRNIGDEYFGAGDGGLFADLDALAIGPVVASVIADFDRYWDCSSSYPASQILPLVSEAQRRKLTRRASLVEKDPSARQFVERITSLPIVQSLLEGTLELTWAEVELISDDPAKACGDVDSDGLLATQLLETLGNPTREMFVVAGYFVPGDTVTRSLCDMASSGVAVSVLTNSFAATDVKLVHAGYAQTRKELLQSGVRLFEMYGTTHASTSRKERRRGSRLGIGSTLRGSGTGSTAALRSHASTLHAKTFSVDGERLFIGSFNLDPRSIELNTELGFVIHSPDLAKQVGSVFERLAPAAAYELRLQEDGRLSWVERHDDEEIVHTEEPNMTLGDHLMIGVAQRLPIQWLL
ncbi:phospholipase D family protein [Sphingobium yanoikuyae]|uniref:Phospholipase D n=1 Tax=Sphingobium yanoikuyae TaxID=13690 RepID=A0A430BFI4_SPHYA|nr:phospholipase D family protein [Sphingobium yanoikuyae]KAK0335481.1 hypothetical protein LTR94_012571 [Friedmanniomyces endolithicus]RSU48373.1 phospholipase D family protein [Sphingobium yanoikuyae]